LVHELKKNANLYTIEKGILDLSGEMSGDEMMDK